MTTTTHNDSGFGALMMAYRTLKLHAVETVRASWRFGQCIDSLSDSYTYRDMAEGIGVSVSTINRYRRFFGCYQRPELAVQASERLETFNIDLLTHFAETGNLPVRGRPALGRHYRYVCTACRRTDTVQREEYDPDAPEEPATGPGVVVPVRFAGASG